MSRFTSNVTGKAQTILGPIFPHEMGITLSHEHCLLDISCVYQEPKNPPLKGTGEEPLSFGIVGHLRYHPQNNRDNLILLNEQQATTELKCFKEAGGGTIIDATNVDLRRNPEALKRISQTTGLHIVMGSGYYVKIGQHLDVMEKRSEEDIAEEMIQNLFEGVDGTGLRSGMIGELGCSWPLEDCERKVLRAGGIAQRESGAPLMIHPGRSEKAPLEIVNILKEVGADLNHTVISHVDRTVFEPDNRYALLDQGCYLAYDLWGEESYYPYGTTGVLTDTQRIAHIKDLFAHGYGKKILIGHDICHKYRYLCYGGHGYGHILLNALPVMRLHGMTEDQIKNLLIENPKKCFTFWGND